ncbi:hypothetical protein Tco_1016288 [Tanacetum coccineum]|uniref:Uncharacterized protein n=1 Tax=Tanacetum coccineum TaxID=301880 RepID=A0ABQ5FPF5_9ASTR
MGEGSTNPTDPHHTPTFIKQRSRRPKRKDTQVPQSSGPIDNVADKAVNEDMDDSLVRATTTATSLDVDADMFRVNDLEGDEVLVESEGVVKTAEERINVVEEVADIIDDAKSVSAVGENINAAEEKLILMIVLHLAQALAELKTAPKPPQDKGKGIMIEEPMVEKEKLMKKQEQMRINEELAFKLQAKEEE